LAEATDTTEQTPARADQDTAPVPPRSGTSPNRSVVYEVAKRSLLENERKERSPGRVVDVPIAKINVCPRHRTDMGDLQALADSIKVEDLLQPIGITEHYDLVFGYRRLRACRDILGWTVIAARFVKVTCITAGEYAENEVRKDFTVSERVAILATLNLKPEGRPGAN
jgi:hypothetical protein